MQESLILFEAVVISRWFSRTSIILLLNKIDVFKSKLSKVCIHCCEHMQTRWRFAGPNGEILSRIYRWRRPQQSGKIYSMEVHASQPSAPKYLPSVSVTYHGSLTIHCVLAWHKPMIRWILDSSSLQSRRQSWGTLSKTRIFCLDVLFHFLSFV